MEEITAYLKSANAYGVLEYAAHGTGLGDTGGQTFASFSAADEQMAWLVLWRYFEAAELTICQNELKTYWYIALTKEYTDNKPAEHDIAIIATCFGIFSGDFNAACRLGGGVDATIGQLRASFTCLMSHLVDPDSRTITQAGDACTDEMTDPGFGFGIVNGDWQLFPFDNTAAAVNSFDVVGGEARWRVESERATARYHVFGSQDTDSKKEYVMFDLAGAGLHTVPVSGFQLYWLYEEEQSGAFRYLGVARDELPSQTAAEPGQSLGELKDSYWANRAAHLEEKRAGSEDFVGEGKRMLIFTETPLVEAYESSVADFYHTFQDYTVYVIDYTTLGMPPESVHVAIKEAVADSFLEEGELTVLLGGPGSDAREFDMNDLGPQYWPSSWMPIHDQQVNDYGFPPGGDPQRNKIPYFMVQDTLPRDQNTAWITPYLPNEDVFGDIDGDGHVEVAVTRLPFLNETDVWSWADGLWEESSTVGIGTIAYLKGDVDHGDPGSGARAAAVADVTKPLLPPGATIVELLESVWPVDSDRNTQTAALWNTNSPDVVVVVGSWSNRYWPGNFFDLTNSSNPWSMAMVTTWHRPIVIVGTCSGTDTWRTQDPAYGESIPYYFLSAWQKGARGWLGPSAGSWHHANGIVLKYIFEELQLDSALPVPEALRRAKNRIHVDYAQEPEVMLTSRSYMFLGGPSSRIMQMEVPTAIHDSPVPEAVGLGQAYPNPFNAVTQIRYAVSVQGPVRLKVYNAAGQLVRTLVDEAKLAGTYTVEWDGSNNKKQKVATGAYFYRLEAEGTRLTKKVVLLK